MIFVDTGYLIALFDKTDSLHERARNWANCIRTPLITTEFVLLETFNYFSKLHHREKVAVIDRIVRGGRYKLIPMSSELFREGEAFHRLRSDKAWSVTDCISFLIMRRHNATLALAFDQHFSQAGFEALLQREPQA